MIILPAIDLLDGKVVRLTQGKRDQVTVYSDDPVGIARRWKAQGAQWLHVVDLNGALDGTYINLPLAERIIQEVGLQVELSGGIRTKEALSRALAAGASRVILGTKACEDPAFVQEASDRFGHKIAVAIDAKRVPSAEFRVPSANSELSTRNSELRVVSRGWVASTDLTPARLTRSVMMLGIETIICTDVGRDGMLQGPNLELIEEVLAVGPLRVIASGGISSLDDLKRLKTLEDRGVVGAIVGKALYEGTIALPDAIRATA